jgi:hypothetical protein
MRPLFPAFGGDAGYCSRNSPPMAYISERHASSSAAADEERAV